MILGRRRYRASVPFRRFGVDPVDTVDAPKCLSDVGFADKSFTQDLRRKSQSLRLNRRVRTWRRVTTQALFRENS